MATPNDLEQQLAQHASGLRSMARDLVRDPHAADDVVQDTMHRALTSTPRPGPLGGWLRRTLVNFTHQWHRSERRRIARETKATAPRPEDSPAESTSRREALRAVTNAVLALDEPYQTAIFLRYFEDLPPRAIAKRTGANLATIKSRLQRGLAMLRARLDRESGGDRRQWRLALLGTFGLPATSAAAGLLLTTGTVIMGTTTKTLLAAGVLGAIGLYFYGFGDDPIPVETSTAGKGNTASANTATIDARPEDTTTIREAALPPEEVPSWLEHPFTFELEVRVISRLGMPVEAAAVHLGPAGCSINAATVATGPDGKASVRWPSRVRQGEIVIAEKDGTLRKIAVQHGRPTLLTIEGSEGEGMRAFLTRPSSGNLSLTISGLAAGSYAIRNSTATPQMREGLHPYAQFVNSPGAARNQIPSPDLFVSYHGLTAGTVTLDLAAGIKDSGGENPRRARIAGTVFGEDGKPAAKVVVALLGNDDHANFHVLTDENGQFEFEKLRPGEFRVRAGGCSRGLAIEPAITTTGTTPVTLHLSRGSAIRGRANHAEGRPIAKARVTWHALDGSWCDSTETERDGSFVLANLPAKPGMVMLWQKEQPFPTAFAKNVLPNTNDLLLRDEEAISSLIVDPIQHDSLSGFAMVRVWNVDTGVGTTMHTPKDGAPWALWRVPAGWYRVELFHPATGSVDAGRHWVDGQTDCDIGRVVMPEPASVGLAIEGGATGKGSKFELYRLRRDLDVRVQAPELHSGGRYLIEAGDYALFWVAPSGSVETERFSVDPGGEIVVRIP